MELNTLGQNRRNESQKVLVTPDMSFWPQKWYIVVVEAPFRDEVIHLRDSVSKLKPAAAGLYKNLQDFLKICFILASWLTWSVVSITSNFEAV